MKRLGICMSCIKGTIKAEQDINKSQILQVSSNLAFVTYLQCLAYSSTNPSTILTVSSSMLWDLSTKITLGSNAAPLSRSEFSGQSTPIYSLQLHLVLTDSQQNGPAREFWKESRISYIRASRRQEGRCSTRSLRRSTHCLSWDQVFSRTWRERICPSRTSIWQVLPIAKASQGCKREHFLKQIHLIWFFDGFLGRRNQSQNDWWSLEHYVPSDFAWTGA